MTPTDRILDTVMAASGLSREDASVWLFGTDDARFWADVADRNARLRARAELLRGVL